MFAIVLIPDPRKGELKSWKQGRERKLQNETRKHKQEAELLKYKNGQRKTHSRQQTVQQSAQ